MWDGRRYDRTGQPGAAVPHRLILTCRLDTLSVVIGNFASTSNDNKFGV